MALERASILTARELLLTPIMQLHMMRGVGNQTRREITEFRCAIATAVSRSG
jgi:hypothetical protein